MHNNLEKTQQASFIQILLHVQVPFLGYKDIPLVDFKWPCLTSKVRIHCNFSIFNTVIKYE